MSDISLPNLVMTQQALLNLPEEESGKVWIFQQKKPVFVALSNDAIFIALFKSEKVSPCD